MAIIVSILLAFGIDAWWEDRRQRQDETILLQAILDDLEEKRKRVVTDKRYNQAILDSSKTLVNAGASAQQDLENIDIDRHIGFTCMGEHKEQACKKSASEGPLMPKLSGRQLNGC